MDNYMHLNVSKHCYDRYRLRVDATCEDPNLALVQMWNAGMSASLSQMSIYGAGREHNYQYRICAAENGMVFLLVVTGGTLITLLEPKLSKREVHKRLPRKFKQRGGGYQAK